MTRGRVLLQDAGNFQILKHFGLNIVEIEIGRLAFWINEATTPETFLFQSPRISLSICLNQIMPVLTIVKTGTNALLTRDT